MSSQEANVCAPSNPCGPVLLLETLHYADEIKKSGYVFGDIKDVSTDADEKDLAKQLIKRKVGEFEPEGFHDHYSDALRELVNSRIENREPVIPEERPAAKVVNLMDALRAILREPSASAANDSAEKPKVKAASKARVKPAAQRKAG